MTSWGHNFDEIGIVIEGSILFTMAGEQCRLNAGDTVYVPRNTGHTAENDGDLSCTCYWLSASDGQ
jgi:mannose-6-phosphate isomerase-like protein (cupin superfamily)